MRLEFDLMPQDGKVATSVLQHSTNETVIENAFYFIFVCTIDKDYPSLIFYNLI